MDRNKHKNAIRRRKMREKNLRVESILDAAKKVFFAKGYSRATMDEIALEAEISKPTIYQYFKSKDDLFFSLMLPVIEEIGNQLATIKDHLADRRYHSGRRLIGDMFKGIQKSYDMAPDIFRIIQLFQQTGLVQELNPQIRESLNEKGSFNFKTARQIIEMGIDQKLIRETNPFEYVDVFWGMFVGIIQLEDIKSQSRPEKRFIKPTLKLAEEILIDAMAVEHDKRQMSEKEGEKVRR